jgi:hypothetical protein
MTMTWFDVTIVFASLAVSYALIYGGEQLQNVKHRFRGYVPLGHSLHFLCGACGRAWKRSRPNDI